MPHTIAPTLRSELTRIDFTDSNHFNSIVCQRPVCYANGWLYHLRSARNNDGSAGFQFLEQDVFATIGFRNEHSICVSPIGERRFSVIPELCRSIAKDTSLPVILKKVDRELSEYLLTQTGFHLHRDKQNLEDENFPEHLLELQTLFDASGSVNSKAKQLQRRFRRFERNVGQLRHEDNCEYGGGLRTALETMLEDFHEKRLAYSQMCEFIESHSALQGRFQVRAFYCNRNQMQGLYIAEKLSEQTAGLYCAVTSRQYPDATEWMDVNFFHMLWQAGYRRLLLGGSETSGVHHYVKKLLPVELPDTMFPLIYKPFED